MAASVNQDIPVYSLYGEQQSVTPADFVHIEDVQARSQQLSWRIAAHRHHALLQLICVFDGQWQASLDGSAHLLEGNSIAVIPAGVVHGFHFSPGTRGYVLSINTALLSRLSGSAEINNMFLTQWQPQVIEECDRQAVSHLRQYLGLLKQELGQPAAQTSLVIEHLIQLIFIAVNRSRQSQQVYHEGSDVQLLSRFKALIDIHYISHWPVARYAAALFVSASTLNRVCARALGLSPKQLIVQRLHNEAKRRLLYTRQPLEGIASTLGYKDTAYFCRTFKQCEGMTAGHFRKQHRY
ncbi:helix-turn-helix domain-containing protein [Salinimonas lutimaris]|uniref:helix-turn-helix domain-containing protein n=1 Tax=Salinimonas lutimaris TaxID=914153 RepID=UPI0010C043E1|nr:helix-turn-helix domain-containing protein [Salinimonas lutimaris]